MLRALLLSIPAISVLVVACSPTGPGRAAIVDRCVAGGEAPEVCKCFADASAAKLDSQLFQLVVLGAQGEESKTDQIMKALSPERQAEFAKATREIIAGCGATGYPSGN